MNSSPVGQTQGHHFSSQSKLQTPPVPDRKSTTRLFQPNNSSSSNQSSPKQQHQSSSSPTGSVGGGGGGGKIAKHASWNSLHTRRYSDISLPNPATQSPPGPPGTQQATHGIPSSGFSGGPGSVNGGGTIPGGLLPQSMGGVGMFSWQLSDSRLFGMQAQPMTSGVYGGYMSREMQSSSRSSLANSVIYEMLELDPELFNVTLDSEVQSVKELLDDVKELYAEKTNQLVRSVLCSITALSDVTENSKITAAFSSRKTELCEHSNQFTRASHKSTIIDDGDSENDSDDISISGAQAFGANMSREATLKASPIGVVITDSEQHLVDGDPPSLASPGVDNIGRSRISGSSTSAKDSGSLQRSNCVDINDVYNLVENNLNEEVDQLRQHVRELEESLTQLKDDLETKDKDLKDKSEQFQNERKTLSDTCERLGQENQALKDDNQKLNETLRMLQYENSMIRSKCVCHFHGGSLQQIPMGFVEQNPWTPKHVKTASIVQSQANRRRNAYQDPDENDDEDSVGSHLAPLEDVTTPVQSTKVLGPSSKYRSNVSSQHSMDQDKSGDFLGGSGSQRMKGRGSGKNGVAPGIRSLDVEADFEDTPMGSKKSSCANTDVDSTPSMSASGTSILGSAPFNPNVTDTTSSPYSSEGTSLMMNQSHPHHTNPMMHPSYNPYYTQPMSNHPGLLPVPFTSQKSVSAEQIAAFSPFPTNSLQHDRLALLAASGATGMRTKNRHSSAGPAGSYSTMGAFDPMRSPNHFSTVQTPRPGRASVAGSNFEAALRTPRDTRRHSVSSSVYNLSLSDAHNQQQGQSTSLSSMQQQQPSSEYFVKVKLDTHISTWSSDFTHEWLKFDLKVNEHVIANFVKNVKDAPTLLRVKQNEFKSILGITDKFERKRVYCALSFLNKYTPPNSRVPANEEMRNLLHLDYDWMCDFFLEFVGLAEYRREFLRSRVDGVFLNGMSADDIEYVIQNEGKSSKATKQCAVSIWYGWQLMKLLRYDEKTLKKRMLSCRNWDSDPIVWSNDRFFEYLKQQNFEAEAKNLNGLGIHGALLVLSKSFTIEKLFDKMKLNNSKQYSRARENLYRKLNNLLSSPRQQAMERLEALQNQQSGQGAKDSSKSRSVPALLGYATRGTLTN